MKAWLMVTDLFRGQGAGAAVGVMHACGTLGASASTWLRGLWLAGVGDGPVFAVLAALHLLAAVVLQGSYGRCPTTAPAAPCPAH